METPNFDIEFGIVEAHKVLMEGSTMLVEPKIPPPLDDLSINEKLNMIISRLDYIITLNDRKSYETEHEVITEHLDGLAEPIKKMKSVINDINYFEKKINYNVELFRESKYT